MNIPEECIKCRTESRFSKWPVHPHVNSACVHIDNKVGLFPAGEIEQSPGFRHGFSEILYAYTSGTGNNGSAFAGLSANTLFYNVTIGFAMLIGRFIMIVPMMAVVGSLAAKKIVPASAGTFPTTGTLWVGLLVGVILIMGGLTYFPALALGPVVEHFAMHAGNLF